MSTGIVTRRKSAMHIDNSYGIDVVAANTNLVSKRVLKGEPFSTQIVCDEGYSVYEITIKMGGVDITSTAYDPTYNMITIPSVTDDVDIECYAMHTMPSGYVRVDGIKNPSNAYLNTGYTTSYKNIITVDFTKAAGYVIATKSSGNVNIIGTVLRIYADGKIMYDENHTGVKEATGSTTDRNTFIFDHYNGKAYLNGTLKRSYNRGSDVDTLPAWLFRSSYTADTTNSPDLIIHSCYIFDATTKVYERYYIPCLNTSGIAGFWDAARGVFQGSSNSTAFEAIYVQDGLIFQLDGINKGSNADAWTDLKGGLVFTKYGNVTSISKGWDFPSADRNNGFLCSGSTLTGNGVPFTIEACYMPKSQNAAAIIGLHSTKGLAFAQSSGRYTFRQNYNRYSFVVSINTGHTVSLNNNIGIDNYIELEKSTVDSWTVNIGTNEITIGRFRDGSSSWSYPLYGELYAIRLYNRSLTKEEIMRNQAIDNARFGLGLTIPQTT